LPDGGQGQSRAAGVDQAGLPLSTNCTTLLKMCGSAMKAAMCWRTTRSWPEAPTSWSPAAWKA
jgi:hypothetical protein